VVYGDLSGLACWCVKSLSYLIKDSLARRASVSSALSAPHGLSFSSGLARPVCKVAVFLVRNCHCEAFWNLCSLLTLIPHSVGQSWSQSCQDSRHDEIDFLPFGWMDYKKFVAIVFNYCTSTIRSVSIETIPLLCTFVSLETDTL
jgi:hypothetical protein